MDPTAALAGTSQISIYCQECSSTIWKLVNQAKTVDNGITVFNGNLQALQLTYDDLAASLKDPIMLEAARATNSYAGGHLWTQLGAVLGDCQNTILHIRQALRIVQQSSRRVSSMLKSLAESLKSGELLIAKDIVKLLEQNLACSKAMVNITLQILQPNTNAATQYYITRDLERLKADVDNFCAKVRSVPQSSRSADGRTFRHMEEFASLAKSFLISIATSMGDTPPKPATTVAAEPSPSVERPPAFCSEETTTNSPKTYKQLDAVATTDRSSSISSHHVQSNDDEFDSENENVIELELIAEYIANGQADLTMDDFTSAEENFKVALDTIQKTEFSKPPKYSAGDIILMLVDCCLRQDQEEEALKWLESLADGTSEAIKSDTASTSTRSVREVSEQLLRYKANHILAVVFLKRSDFQAAESRAMQALKGRRKFLGAQDPTTLESVQLLIEIFTAKGDKVNTRAYRRFLEPSIGESRTPLISAVSQVSCPSQPPTTSPSVAPGSTASPAPQPTALLSTTTSRTAVLSTIIHSPVQTRKPLKSPPKLPSTPNTATDNRNPSQPMVVAHMAENESTLITPQAETILPVSPITPTSIEPDPLPPNIGPANTAKKMSWSSPFSRLSINNVEFDTRKKSISVPSESNRRNSPNTGLSPPSQPANTQRRLMSLTGNFAYSDDTKEDYGDTFQPRPSVSSAHTPSINTTLPPPRTRQEMAPRFAAIRSLRQEGKKSVAIDTALKLLEEYDPRKRDLLVREHELRKNMKESHKGLAGTGQGYAPIHFFCERKQECAVEVELLIEQGVDVNVVACRAGMQGTDPFTPLQRAIENGHAEIVRLLIKADVSLTNPRVAKSTTLSSYAEPLQPLLLACTTGHAQITHMLLAAGAARILKEFPARMWHGNSLLHEAAWRGDVDMVTMLLDYSRRIDHDHKQQAQSDGQPNYESGVIGSSSQQDQFGATSIMYAVDIRDCTNDQMRKTKLANRKRCLQLLLEHDVHEDLHSRRYQENVARVLCLKWMTGPGKGHSIFCYADESGDEELMRMLDPFRYQCSSEMRCTATPRCSPSVTRTPNPNAPVEVEGSGRAERLPSCPELMAEPVMVRAEWPQEIGHNENRDSLLSNETMPASFKSAAWSWSASSDHGRTTSIVSGSGSDGRRTGSDR
ncbi:hypothetical protein H2198_003691 [Neophaeococcomyces mojaviensis]|uniref:Uncharacterized protein n=1 Tax=Neophaeococcomyces mojaviensis TaxID=3383035 RepID=A0ACC3AAZ8_9EURO|nr:hypothetical protein H2198_003691 [Knufia sp. JES_112]